MKKTAYGARSALTVGLSIMLVFTLSGCADHVQFAQAAEKEPVGFWYGLWHGMILPFAWFLSLFMDDVAIYAIYNNGGWYDFGFFLGVGAIGSGGR
jgi:hypothetical protein